MWRPDGDQYAHRDDGFSFDVSLNLSLSGKPESLNANSTSSRGNDWLSLTAVGGAALFSDLISDHRAQYLALMPAVNGAWFGAEQEAWFDAANQIDGATTPEDDHPLHAVERAALPACPVEVRGNVHGDRLDGTGIVRRCIADSCLYFQLNIEHEEIWTWRGALRTRHLSVTAYAALLVRSGADPALLQPALQAGLRPADFAALAEQPESAPHLLSAMAALAGRSLGTTPQSSWERTRGDVDKAGGMIAIWGTSASSEFGPWF